MAKNIGRIYSKSSALFLCDMQEKFRRTIKYYPQILNVSARMLQAARVLDMPVIVTEQYPKGLGPTCSELDVSGLPVFPKTNFSMCLPEVKRHLEQNAPEAKSIILCGLETQVCVQNTALDLLAEGYDVHIIADAVSSRSMVDRSNVSSRRRRKCTANKEKGVISIFNTHIMTMLDFTDLKSVILCGIETQACVQNTAMDLLDDGYEVHVIADGVTSRSMVDRMYSLDRMKQAGVFITTSESMILTLVQGSAHPRFKEIQKIIWDEAPDSGLLGNNNPGNSS